MSEQPTSEMEEISLADSVSFIVDNRGKTVPTAEKGIALIATNCISNEHLYPLKINIRYVSEETFESWFRSHPEPDDIIITNKGSNNGEVCLIPPKVDFCIAQDMVALRADRTKISPYYLFASLRSTLVQSRLKRLNVDAVIPHFKKTDFDKLFIPLPSREVQDFIGSFYMVFSRKIENLRRQNETLETIAQALFKHWFVDFEFPNEDGKPYRSSGGEMVRSELGEIPAGWRLKKMEDVIEVRDGTHDSPKQTEEGFHLITSKHLKKEGIDFESAYLISESDYTEVNKRSKVDTYDTLLSMIGTVGLLYFVLDQNINFAIKNIGLFKASKNLDYPEYIFLFLSSEYGKTYFRTRLAGTTQSYLTLSSLRELPLIIPDKAILLGFKQIAKSLFGKSHTNNQQIRTLTKTRDVLLPKLMSGKLRIVE